MKFNCRRKDFTEWHISFAWFPVRLDDKCVWLETVERRGVKRVAERLVMDPDLWGGEFEYWEWEYRQ